MWWWMQIWKGKNPESQPEIWLQSVGSKLNFHRKLYKPFVKACSYVRWKEDWNHLTQFDIYFRWHLYFFKICWAGSVFTFDICCVFLKYAELAVFNSSGKTPGEVPPCKTVYRIIGWCYGKWVYRVNDTLERALEARIAFGYAWSNSYTCLLLFKRPRASLPTTTRLSPQPCTYHYI
jgi:hypothetical protein